jgi:periplasmic protein CpxP/Spy
MRKKIITTLVFCVLFTGLLYSQDGPPRDGPPRDGKKPSAEEMVKMEMKMMKQELDLTETQVSFVKKILEDAYKKMEDSFSSGKKDRDEMEKITKEKDDNLKRVLTEDQWTKYEDIKDKMKNKFKEGDQKPPRPPDRN